MLKYIGIAILSSSVSVYGAILAKQLKDTHALRSEVVELLKSIELGIKYGSKPIRDILVECNLTNIKKSGLITSLISGQSARDAIENSLKALTTTEKNKLCEFFESIGKSTYSENELIICRSYIEFFENSIKMSGREISLKAMLYKKIGIICGILAAIIFI